MHVYLDWPKSHPIMLRFRLSEMPGRNTGEAERPRRVCLPTIAGQPCSTVTDGPCPGLAPGPSVRSYERPAAKSLHLDDVYFCRPTSGIAPYLARGWYLKAALRQLVTPTPLEPQRVRHRPTTSRNGHEPSQPNRAGPHILEKIESLSEIEDSVIFATSQMPLTAVKCARTS